VVLVDAIVDAAEGWIGGLAGRDEQADDGVVLQQIHAVTNSRAGSRDSLETERTESLVGLALSTVRELTGVETF